MQRLTVSPLLRGRRLLLVDGGQLAEPVRAATVLAGTGSAMTPWSSGLHRKRIEAGVREK